MSVLVLLLGFGLAARITRFIARDRLATPIRLVVMRVFGADSQAYYLVGCAWCLSIYIAGGVFAVAWFYGHTAAYMIVAATGTASYLIGLAQTWFDPVTQTPTPRASK